MNKYWRLLFIFLIYFLAACTSNTETTPTPFPQVSTVASGKNNPLIMVELSELAANPEMYEGSMVAVNGRYQSVNPRVCSTTQYNPPSTWGLTTDDWMIYMNGFDKQLKSLLPKGINMSVTGIWRQWRGPVGCGKDAAVQDIWYLDVQKITSPNPLTQITLTPTIPGEVTEIADTGSEPLDPGQPTPITTPVFEEATLPAPGVPESTPIGIEATPTPFSTPDSDSLTATLTPTQPSSNGGIEEGTTPQGTAVATNTTIPTATPNQSMTATPTSSSNSGGSGTPQPTIDPLATSTTVPNVKTVSKGEIISLEVEYEAINAQEIHEWEFEIFANQTFTVTVAGDLNANMILSILDKNKNTIIDHQNLSAADKLEVAVAKNVPTGIYLIQVETVDKIAGHYAIAALDADSLSGLPIAYKGILADGNAVSSTVKTDFEDYWFFYAESRDVVTISIKPFDNNADMYLVLFNDDVDPDGPIIEVDSQTPGATEELINYTISQTGVYMIATSDFNYNRVDYEISLTID